jgi:glycosyltransferase involved in cell wall biosynthesis
MLITVIVPTFNRALQLQEAVESVLAQPLRELEVIIVDDGSTDDTAATIASLQRRDSRVTSLTQPNGGVAAARNLGLDRAQGDLIAFLDSDDRWSPDKLAFQLACLERVPEAGMIWTDTVGIDPGGGLIPGYSLRSLLRFRFALDDLFAEGIPLSDLPDTPQQWRDGVLWVGEIYGKALLGNLVLPSSVLMTRARLERVGRFDQSLEVAGEDFDFFLRVCREGPVAFADVPTVSYRIGHPDQLTHPSRTLYMARNYVRTMEQAIARDPDRVDVPESMLLAARGYGHAWTAQGYLAIGDRGSARRHLRLALGLGSARAWALAPLALLPGPVAAFGIKLAPRIVRGGRTLTNRLMRVRHASSALFHNDQRRSDVTFGRGVGTAGKPDSGSESG